MLPYWCERLKKSRMFHYFRQRKELKQKAKALYDRAETQGRLPVFYADLNVPDTVDGRFEMISLHCYIFMHRLLRAGDKKLSQKLFDTFFVMMDRTMREMGIGDLAVPKHMKRMMQGFNGRANHYEFAIKNKDSEELIKAIRTNIYGTLDDVQQNDLDIMADYILDNIQIKTVEEGFASPKVGGRKSA